MMPPSGGNGETIEVQIGAWWATRLGILLAIIGVVFAAVYISQYTTPALRFAGLTLAALGVCALGLLLERKSREMTQFGAVLFGGGLALLYFTFYAAYAVPAVKIVESVTVAAALQFAMVGVLTGCALWRNSRTIATIAVFLGYISCFFSLGVELRLFALFAAGVLATAAIFFYLARCWSLPMIVAVPFTYAFYLALCVMYWFPDPVLVTFATAMAPLVIYMTLYAAADYVALTRNTLMPHIPRRIVQLMNTTSAVALGFLVTYFLFHDRLEDYYFLFAALLLGGAVAYWLRSRPDVLMHGYFIKGSALLTMGLITVYDARTRWIAIAIQAVVMLFSARRSRLRVVEAVASLAWLVSLGFFAHETVWRSMTLPDLFSLWSIDGVSSLLYLFGSAWLFSLKARWLAPAVTAEPPAIFNQLLQAALRIAGRDGRHGMFAILIALTGVLIGDAYVPQAYFPLSVALIGAALAINALPARHWVPALSGTLMLLAAHLRFWLTHKPAWSDQSVWINGVVLCAITCVAAVAAWEAARRWKHRAIICNQIETAFHALWLFSLQVVFYRLCGYEMYWLSAVAIACAAAGASWLPALRRLAPLSVLPMVYALLGAIHAHDQRRLGFFTDHSLAPLWIATVAAYAYACAFVTVKPLRARLGSSEDADRLAWLHAGLAWFIGLRVLGRAFPEHDQTFMLVLATAAPLVALLARWPGLRPAAIFAIAYTALAHLQFYKLCNTGAIRQAGFLVAAVAAGILTIAYAPLIRRLRIEWTLDRLAKLYWTHGILGLLLLFTAFYVHKGPLENYVSVFWGLSAIAVFVAGLIDRSKPLRLIGLGGLGICIPRVVFIDITDTLYRIAAFMALGVVLLVVGFLYTKYRDVIQRWDAPGS